MSDVISAFGNYFSNNSNTISWTIGECIPETFANSGNKLTQRFQQGVYDLNTAVDYAEIWVHHTNY